MTIPISSDQHPELTVYETWHDGRLSNRLPNGITGTEPNGSPREQPPEWTVFSGFTDGDGHVEDGYLKIPAGDTTTQRINAPFDYPYCRWTIEFERQADPTAGAFVFRLGSVDANPYRWRVNWDSSETLLLEEWDSGATSQITSSQAKSAARHTIVVEHKSGGWEMFLDGTSLGTATRNYWPADIGLISIVNTEDVGIWVNQLSIEILGGSRPELPSE